MCALGKMGRGDPSLLDASGLMALEGLALRSQGEAASLAERPGTTATPRRGQGHEIREIRPFAEGDDPRHIDAAATARAGSPQIRSFHEDRERSLLLIADFRRPMLWGTKTRLRSVAGAQALMVLGWRTALQGGSVGVVALTDAGPQVQTPRPRHRGMAQVAGLMERAHAEALAFHGPVRPLAPDLIRALRQAPRGAAVALATGLDLPGEGLDEALAALRRRGPLRLILVEDAFERAPPSAPLPHLGAHGPAFARFDHLPADRAARAARLAVPGVELRRLDASGEIG